MSGMLEGAFLARVGGDEFAAIVTGSPAPTRAGRLAERILGAVSEPFEMHGDYLHVGLSIGIALYPIDGVDDVALLDDIAATRREQGYPVGMAARDRKALDMLATFVIVERSIQDGAE